VRPLEAPRLVAPYRRPPKIWGIGLNYRAHARDLGVPVPDEPASFMKPATTIVGPGDPIRLPAASQRVTAEGELGLVLGRRCRDLTEEEVEAALFGYVPVTDMTAEDILRRNPRFLTRAKSFATFLSFGPWIHTVEEVRDLPGRRVATVRNGATVAENTIRDMTFSPFHLVAFFSRVFVFEPADLLCTGTPGAAVIEDGDTVATRVEGFADLVNPVRRERTTDAEGGRV
jgi:2-keto-4-pentenoate hydratase/2-oxohepta-3-ene-1,7-dioic acid hydratase in catechol pathway